MIRKMQILSDAGFEIMVDQCGDHVQITVMCDGVGALRGQVPLPTWKHLLGILQAKCGEPGSGIKFQTGAFEPGP